MAIIKRLVILMVVLASPLAVGLLFTYDVIKPEWISFMEIQPSFRSQRDPLPLPQRSIPIQGAVSVPELGAPANPAPGDPNSIQRGAGYYQIHCAHCHGIDGSGTGTFAAFLVQKRPPSLLEGNPKTMSDGALFQTISGGVTGGMPPLRENLLPAMRWDVVNYLRSLQK
ncbi:MAG TPA: cytochrome c [Anaerolineaceae bacterium]